MTKVPLSPARRQTHTPPERENRGRKRRRLGARLLFDCFCTGPFSDAEAALVPLWRSTLLDLSARPSSPFFPSGFHRNAARISRYIFFENATKVYLLFVDSVLVSPRLLYAILFMHHGVALTGFP